MQNFVNIEFKHYKKYENMLLQRNTFKNSETFCWGPPIFRRFSLFMQYGESNSREGGGRGDDCIFQVIHNKIM